MRYARQILRQLAKENADETQRIGDAEDTHCNSSNRHPPVFRAADEHGLGEEHFFGEEAVEQWHTGHGGTRHDGQRGSKRQHPVQAAQDAHVAGAAFMVDDASGHEQRGLEDGVVERMENCGDHTKRRANAQQHRDQAQVADGGISQQAFQVVLENRHEGADQQRADPCPADDPVPFRRTGQCRPKTYQQEHAGLHHGGRMQVGRHRRWRRHRVRQPEMERELRALGQRAEGHQDQRR